MFKSMARTPPRIKITITKGVVFSLVMVGIVLFLIPLLQGKTGHLNIAIDGNTGSYDSLYITLEEIQVKTDLEGSSWETIEMGPVTYNLSQTTNELIKSRKMMVGNYTEIRFWVSEASLLVGNVTYSVTVPSARMKVEKSFEIKPDTHTNITFQMYGDDIVIRAANEYLLVPSGIKINIQS